MAVLKETEIKHEILGDIRFDDGEPIDDYSHQDGEQMWIARPNGYDDPDEFEIYLAGNSDSPEEWSVSRAISAFNDVDNIVKQGIEIANDNIWIGWIDCRKTIATVAFVHETEVYDLWQGWLDEKNVINDFTKGYW